MKYTLRWIAVIPFWILIYQNEVQGSIRFQRLTHTQGLSHNNALSVLKDREGFIWIGTENGLNRFNGYDFEIFIHSPTDTTSIEQGLVIRLMEDSKGNLWAATNGLNLFDRETATFTRIHFNTIDQSYTHNTYAHAILEGENGSLWVGTYTGLYLFNPADRTLEHFMLDSLGGMQQNTIRAIKSYNSDNLVVGTQQRGVQLFNIKTKQFSPITIRGKHAMEGKEILTLLVDYGGRIWAGSRGDGVAIIDIGSQTIQNVSTANGLPDNYIYAIAQSRDSSVWIGTDGGLCQIEQNPWLVTCHLAIQDDKESPSSNSITNLFIDNTGIVWATTRFGGVTYYDPNRLKFRHFRRISDDARKPSISSVRGFAESLGSIWLATDGGGVQIFNPETGTIKPFMGHRASRELSTAKVQSIVTDAHGTIWFAVWDGGVYSYNPMNGELLNYNHSKGLTNRYILSLLVDSNNNIWAGSWKDGPYLLNRRTGRFDQHPTHDGLRTSIVNCMVEDEAGSIWFGTQSSGLYLMCSSTGTVNN